MIILATILVILLVIAVVSVLCLRCDVAGARNRIKTLLASEERAYRMMGEAVEEKNKLQETVAHLRSINTTGQEVFSAKAEELKAAQAEIARLASQIDDLVDANERLLAQKKPITIKIEKRKRKRSCR